jgi:hypothetical protein
MTQTDGVALDPDAHRAIASALFNHVWTLIEKADRTPEDDDEMIHAAHASRFHWGRARGVEPVNLARGEWQCSRAYAVLGRAEPAMWHARRCLAIVEDSDIGDFDLAAAYEALARASAVAADRDGVTAWKAKALRALDEVADPDDREPIERDLATLP